MAALQFFSSAIVTPPFGNMLNSPVSGPFRTPEVSGKRVMSTPTVAARRLISSISQGSTQPGMILTLPFLRVVGSAMLAIALTMLEKPVTCEPT